MGSRSESGVCPDHCRGDVFLKALVQTHQWLWAAESTSPPAVPFLHFLGRRLYKGRTRGVTEPPGHRENLKSFSPLNSWGATPINGKQREPCECSGAPVLCVPANCSLPVLCTDEKGGRSPDPCRCARRKQGG
jgi:hypothetical protein